MVQPGGSGWWWTSTGALPGIETDVVVITARRHKCRLGAIALGQFESQDAAVKAEGTLKVGDLQVDVAYAHTRGDRTD